jgi:glyoxylase-like metal-dependent hydrolase (beta-lactamase superfamily II)/rhodanese-related sulfurtransferase
MSASISTITTDELVPLLDQVAAPFLVDVREVDEFADWFIPGAHNIPLGELENRVGEIDASNGVVVICARGARAQQGAEKLHSLGISSRVLEGGMGRWAGTYDVVEGDFAGATVVQLRRRGKGCLSYVVGANSTCVVIDPSIDIDRYLGVAAEHGWTITDIVDTHLHADHISGGRLLREATGATLRLSPNDPFQYEYDALADGDDIELAAGVRLTVSAVSVPGHTEGSTLYRIGDAAVFTGDTLFLESVGRPDLADEAESFAHNLYTSLHERVMPLPDATMIFPAHYGNAVDVRAGEFVAKPLGELRGTLPALRLSEPDFVAWAVKSVKDRPPNYQRIVKINAGLESLSDDAAEAELGPNRCAIA